MSAVLADVERFAIADTATANSETQPPPYPQSVFIYGRISAEVSVISPIEVSVERDEDGTLIASDDIFLVYGTGGTVRAALDDYSVSLIDYFELLRAEETSSGRDQSLNKLRRYLSINADYFGDAEYAGDVEYAD